MGIGTIGGVRRILRSARAGARSPEHCREQGRTLAFYVGHPHEWVLGLWTAESPLASTELMHVLIVPSHRDLQDFMQLR